MNYGHAIEYLTLRVAEYQTLCGERAAIIDQLRKENAELREKVEWLKADVHAAQLEADGSPG